MTCCQVPLLFTINDGIIEYHLLFAMTKSNVSIDRNEKEIQEFTLDWTNKDIEQRIGINGGRFTRANTFFSFLLSILLSLVFYGILVYLLEPNELIVNYCEKFTSRGFTPYTIVFLFFWGASTLFVKWRKLLFQEQALDLAVVPQEPDFSLNTESANAVLERTSKLVDSARNFILLNRIEVALCNLNNIGQLSDVSSILSNQSRIDEQQVATSYNLVRGFIWATPVLGFIGTVLGLGDAIGGFGQTIAGTQEVDAIKESLGRVTAGLSTAFDTTLVGLLATILLHFMTNFLKFRESLFLDQCNDYCQVHVLAKLKLSNSLDS
jgi:biopolymer transport protein ExbB/TolQ